MKTESKILKDLGKMFEIFKKLINAVLDRGGSDENVLKLLSDDNLVGRVADMLVGIRVTANDTITRKTTVNRSQTPKEALVATGRNQYVDDKVAKTMPTGEGEEVTVTFFKPTEEEYTRPGWISDDDLEKCYQRRGLKPDPRAQAKVNEDDPSFADDHPNGTHWKDSSGKWCFVTFHGWHVARDVHVDRYDNVWRDDWWFAGVPASN